MTRRMMRIAPVAVSLVIGLVGGAALVTAQDATPEAAGEEGYPVEIHSGTCDDAGDSVATLERVTGEALSDEPDATPILAEDAQGGEIIGRSRSTVDLSLADLLAEEHSIIVHAGPDKLGEFLACGDIVGEANTEGSLIMGLEEVGDSGVMGQAVLEGDDDGTINVTVTLADAEGDTMATPEG